MGMYTELILGCSLKLSTPPEIIDVLRFLIGIGEKVPKAALPGHPFFETERWRDLFSMASYYFGVSEPLRRMWKDGISGNWIISTRSNIKNYDDEIGKFLDWIKPYVESGSGAKKMYAVVTYEEGEPKLFSLREGKEYENGQ